MRFVITILLTALLSFATSLYLPWWSIALVAFIIAFFLYQKPAMAFLSGFIALLLLWGSLAMWIDLQNEHVLAGRMAVLFPLKGNFYLLILISAVLAGIIAGLAALSGSLLFRYLQQHESLAVKQFMKKLPYK